MSDNQFDDGFEFDDSFDQDRPNGPKALREYAKRQKEENEKLREDFEKFRKETRERELKRFAESKGLSAEAIALIGDQDPDEWYTKMVAAGLVPAQSNNSANEGTNNEPPAGDDNEGGEGNEGPAQHTLTPEQRQQLAGVTSVQPGNSAPNTSGAADLSELDGVSSLDEAMAILAKRGLVAPEKSQTIR